jgi:hypothetical protein
VLLTYLKLRLPITSPNRSKNALDLNKMNLNLKNNVTRIGMIELKLPIIKAISDEKIDLKSDHSKQSLIVENKTNVVGK